MNTGRKFKDCDGCGRENLDETMFSKTQFKNSLPGKRRCKSCTANNYSNLPNNLDCVSRPASESNQIIPRSQPKKKPKEETAFLNVCMFGDSLEDFYSVRNFSSDNDNGKDLKNPQSENEVIKFPVAFLMVSLDNIAALYVSSLTDEPSHENQGKVNDIKALLNVLGNLDPNSTMIELCRGSMMSCISRVATSYALIIVSLLRNNNYYLGGIVQCCMIDMYPQYFASQSNSVVITANALKVKHIVRFTNNVLVPPVSAESITYVNIRKIVGFKGQYKSYDDIIPMCKMISKVLKYMRTNVWDVSSRHLVLASVPSDFSTLNLRSVLGGEEYSSEAPVDIWLNNVYHSFAGTEWFERIDPSSGDVTPFSDKSYVFLFSFDSRYQKLADQLLVEQFESFGVDVSLPGKYEVPPFSSTISDPPIAASEVSLHLIGVKCCSSNSYFLQLSPPESSKNDIFVNELISGFDDLVRGDCSFCVEFVFAKLLCVESTLNLCMIPSVDIAYEMIEAMVRGHAPIHNATLFLMDNIKVSLDSKLEINKPHALCMRIAKVSQPEKVERLIYLRIYFRDDGSTPEEVSDLLAVFSELNEFSDLKLYKIVVAFAVVSSRGMMTLSVIDKESSQVNKKVNLLNGLFNSDCHDHC